MTIGHIVLKICVPCKNFHMPSHYFLKPCKVYVHCWENKYMARLKNHLPSRACNHKSLFALGKDLHALSMQAHLNFEPWNTFSFELVHSKMLSAKWQPFCLCCNVLKMYASHLSFVWFLSVMTECQPCTIDTVYVFPQAPLSLTMLWCAVYPKEYAYGFVVLCVAMVLMSYLWIQVIYLLISFRVASQALGQSYDCPRPPVPAKWPWRIWVKLTHNKIRDCGVFIH